MGLSGSRLGTLRNLEQSSVPDDPPRALHSRPRGPVIVPECHRFALCTSASELLWHGTSGTLNRLDPALRPRFAVLEEVAFRWLNSDLFPSLLLDLIMLRSSLLARISLCCACLCSRWTVAVPVIPISGSSSKRLVFGMW